VKRISKNALKKNKCAHKNQRKKRGVGGYILEWINSNQSRWQFWDSGRRKESSITSRLMRGEIMVVESKVKWSNLFKYQNVCDYFTNCVCGPYVKNERNQSEWLLIIVKARQMPRVTFRIGHHIPYL